MSLRLVLMGSGRFALPTFLSLFESDHEVVGLFTQPDRTGRGHHRHAHPLKEEAVARGTPVFQPENVNKPDPLTRLRELNADLCVVAAYGQILSEQLIEIPKFGAINLHASLLPKFRGAAPVHYAILNGETETGVTIFQIEPKLDAGPVLSVVKTPIGPKETTGELEIRLAELAAPLTQKIIDQIETGTVEQIPQHLAEVTRAPRLKKSAGAIDWTRSGVEIERHVRAMQPWPGPFTFLVQVGRQPTRLIVLDVQPTDINASSDPGRIVIAEGQRLIVRTGEGCVEITRLRPEGKREMTADEFLRGHRLGPGDHLNAG